MVASLYITHPEVAIEPGIPVPQWGLSKTGLDRCRRFAATQQFADGSVFVSSAERKATEMSEILAASCNGRIMVNPECGENNRASTGYLPATEFEAQVDLFFGQPEASANGWETAKDAQARIVAAVTGALKDFPTDHPVVFIGHGGVGTLLKCHVAGRAIARVEDQRETAHPGGGNCFVFDLAQHRLLCDWTAIEDWRRLENA